MPNITFKNKISHPLIDSSGKLDLNVNFALLLLKYIYLLIYLIYTSPHSHLKTNNTLILPILSTVSNFIYLYLIYLQTPKIYNYPDLYPLLSSQDTLPKLEIFGLQTTSGHFHQIEISFHRRKLLQNDHFFQRRSRTALFG